MRVFLLVPALLLAGCASSESPDAPAAVGDLLCLDASDRPVDCLGMLRLPWREGSDRLCIDERYRPTACPEP